MQFSKYTHAFSLGNDVALYNSLRMKPIYLSKEKYMKINNFINSNDENIPDNLSTELNELKKYKIIIKNDEIDLKIMNFVKSKIQEPAINICYFILSEQCNLACKYCFLGNNNKETRGKFHKENMSKEIAFKGIKYFIKQLELQPLDENRKPNVIFYGGEPLINFETLDFIVCKFKELQATHPVLKNIEYSIITNGLLLSEERMKRLYELNVAIAISIDGCDEKANQMRVDIAGNTVFHKIVKTLDLAHSIQIPVSLSITLTEESIKNKTAMLELIKKYEIKGLGFNIMMSDTNTKLSETYNIAAANFIIDMFKELRKIGVYEDRIMRKLKSFTSSQIYFSDCAATSGGQIVIASNGEIGICHGCLADRKYFDQNVNNLDFDPKHNTIWKEWSRLSPIEKEECQNCEALGICGGGCPINATNEKEGNDIHSLDTRFCIHAKTTLEFFISDLYRIVSGREEKCQKISL